MSDRRVFEFYGSEASGLVHQPWCEFAIRIADENLVCFEELHDALSAGYQEAGCCLTDGSFWHKAQVREQREVMRGAFRSQGCWICGEERGVQRAHVVPRSAGGEEHIPLCPSHHWAYDHGELRQDELAALEESCREARGDSTANAVRQHHGAVRRRARGLH